VEGEAGCARARPQADGGGCQRVEAQNREARRDSRRVQQAERDGDHVQLPPHQAASARQAPSCGRDVTVKPNCKFMTSLSHFFLHPEERRDAAADALHAACCSVCSRPWCVARSLPCASARAPSREAALGGQSQMQHTAQCSAHIARRCRLAAVCVAI